MENSIFLKKGLTILLFISLNYGQLKVRTLTLWSSSQQESINLDGVIPFMVRNITIHREVIPVQLPLQARYKRSKHR